MPRRLDRMRARQWVNEGFRKDEMDRSGRQTAGRGRLGVSRGKEVADKGRRSFLRRVEGQGEYNA
jgi:hypothetical protein